MQVDWSDAVACSCTCEYWIQTALLQLAHRPRPFEMEVYSEHAANE